LQMSETRKSEAFFDKVVFGGYDTVQVDEFVIEAKKIIAQYKKENAALTQKLKVLAGEIESYRSASSDDVNSGKDAVENAAESEGQSEDGAARQAVFEAFVKAGTEKIVSLNAELCAKIDEQFKAQAEALRGGIEKIARAAGRIEEIVYSLEKKAAAAGTLSPAAQSAQPETGAQAEAKAGSAEPASAEEKDRVYYITRITDEEEENTAQDEEPAQAEDEMQEKVSQIAGNIKEPAESSSEKTDVSGNDKPEREVFLSSEGIDISNLSYEEALALVLSKNGIKYKPANRAVADDKADEKTKVMKKVSYEPSIEQIKPGADGKSAEPRQGGDKSSKKQREKRAGLIALIKQGINAILEDEEDDDDLLLSETDKAASTAEMPLLFGKNYDVKKK
jgi:hypothetical protein